MASDTATTTSYTEAATASSSVDGDGSVSTKGSWGRGPGVVIYEPTKIFKSHPRQATNTATPPSRMSKASLERQAARCIVILDPRRTYHQNKTAARHRARTAQAASDATAKIANLSKF